jgi:aspartate oxidase
MAPMAPEELERIIQERMGLVNKEQEQEELFEKQRRQQMQMEMEMVQQQQHLQEERFEQNKMEVEFSHQQQQQQQQHHQQQQQQQMDEVGKSLLEAVKSKKNSRGIHESTKLPYSQHHTYFLLPLKLCRSVRQIMSYFSRVVLGY